MSNIRIKDSRKNIQAECYPEQNRFYICQFTGIGKDYFFLLLSNIFFSVITLGIYAAWAKVRRNRYLYGHTLIAGEALNYHATGTMIFKGRLFATIVLLIIGLLQNMLGLIGIVITFLLLVSIPWIINQSLLFRSHMLSWRNIHFCWCGKTIDIAVALWPFALSVSLYFLAFLKLMLSVNPEEIVTELAIDDFFTIPFTIILLVAIVLWIYGGFTWSFYSSNQFSWGNMRIRSLFKFSHYFRIIIIMSAMYLITAVILGTLVYIFIFFNFNEELKMTFNFIIYAFSLILILSIYLATRFMIRHIIVSHTNAYHKDTLRVACFYSNIQWYESTIFHIRNVIRVISTLGIFYPWAVVQAQQFLADRTAIIFVENINITISDTQDNTSSIASEYSDLVGINVSSW